jgi:hypothetical protein
MLVPSLAISKLVQKMKGASFDKLFVHLPLACGLLRFIFNG